jgi:hypothetical protein
MQNMKQNGNISPQPHTMAHQEDSQCTKISPKLSLLSTKILSQILVTKLAHERAHERGGEDRNFGIIAIL